MSKLSRGTTAKHYIKGTIAPKKLPPVSQGTVTLFLMTPSSPQCNTEQKFITLSNVLTLCTKQNPKCIYPAKVFMHIFSNMDEKIKTLRVNIAETLTNFIY